MKSVQDKIIGPLDEVGSDAAMKQHGHFSGGVWFERDVRAVPLANTKRAYPLSLSYQFQKSLVAPVASNKVHAGEEDEHMQVRREVLEVSVVFLPISLCF